MSSKTRTMYTIYTGNLMMLKECAQRITNALLGIVGKRQMKRFSSLGLLFLIILPYTNVVFLGHVPLISPTRNTNALVTSAEPPTLILTWHTIENETPSPLQSGDRIAGDHIIVNATWIPMENVNGTEIVVNATAIPNVIMATSDNHSVAIDTRALGNNATCILNITTWLLNGSAFSEVYTDIFFGNFFVPSVDILSPNGGEIWRGNHNITWSAKDKNLDEVLTFEVYLSSDNGTTYQLISSGITTYWLSVDFFTFENLSTYRVEVRVFDGIYESSDESDGSFTAGTINPTTSPSTTTSNTSTTNTVPSEESQLAIFMAAAIIMSAILSVIVYFQAKRLP